MRGGARNRSGPEPDPNSARSKKRAEANPDFKAISLPREGYRGKAPTFPLPDVTKRELEVWAETWRTPQAAAWALESWRHRTVGQYVRWSVRMEDLSAAAALASVVVRLADQIGLTPAGLRENGWVVARDEIAARRGPTASAAVPDDGVIPDYRKRFSAVNGEDA